MNRHVRAPAVHVTAGEKEGLRFKGLMMAGRLNNA